MQVRLSAEEEEAFLELVRYLAEDPRCLEMKLYIQHGNVTTYDHCMQVAREAFRLNRVLHLHGEESSLVKAAFLHDYYLYDWHHYEGRLHGYRHPQIAADNARRDFCITKEEQDMIVSHMWPLTLFHAPSSREGWLVTLADKICSSQETLFER